MVQLRVFVTLQLTTLTDSVLASLIPLYYLFLAELHFNSIHISGRNKVCFLFWVLTIALTSQLPIFASFFRSFRLMLIRLGFTRPKIRFFGPAVFYWRAQSKKFGGYEKTISKMVLNGHRGPKTRAQCGFYLNVDYFWIISSKLTNF